MKDFLNEPQANDGDSKWNQWSKYVLITITKIVKTQEKQEEDLNALRLSFEKFKSNVEGKVIAFVAVTSIAVNVILFLISKILEKK